jgi:hypothetical protein
VDEFKQAIESKFRNSFEEADRIKVDRQGLVEQRCNGLFEELVDIAFVLEAEAKEIAEKEKKEMEELEEVSYGKVKVKI